MKEALLQEAKKLPPAYTDTVTSECKAVSHSSTASADDDFFDFERTTATERSKQSYHGVSALLGRAMYRFLGGLALVSICEVSFPQDQCYCAIIGPS